MREQRQEVAEAEENSGMESRDKRGEQQRQRIQLQQDTQAVGRSGCFLLHSDSVARIRILPNSTSGMLDSSLTVVS